MSTTFERLRDALAPDYVVEREISSGGQGTVFLAYDVHLKIKRAIKIIRPEMATATAIERFTREARILANLRHPNVMTVHLANTSGDGLPYYVMDFFEGQTLKDRLARGTMRSPEVRRLAADLLQALEAVHKQGVIHRDIKPANIFVHDGTFVLADFGIAKTPSEDGFTGTDVRPGTVGYMAPEQLWGSGATQRSDLYAVGLVLYEALTGELWSDRRPTTEPDWSGVPRDMIPVLRKALQWDEERRWRDANRFLEAVRATRARRERARTLTIGALGAAVVVAVITRVVSCNGPVISPTHLAIFPFAADDTSDAELGRFLPFLAHPTLSAMMPVVPWSTTVKMGVLHVASVANVARTLRAEYVATGSVTRVGDTVQADLVVADASGEVRRLRASGKELVALGYEIALVVARTVDPDARPPPPPALTGAELEAVLEWVRGQDAFHQNRWQTATEHFSRAVALDSTFLLAAFGLSNAYRWLGTGRPHPELDLKRIRREHRGRLNELDSMMIDAQLAPTSVQRLTIYQSAIARYPRDGFVAFLYGEELMHRGPFLGNPLGTAADALEAAVAKDSTLAPALDMLVWANIRMDRPAEATRHLSRLIATSAPPQEVQLYSPILLRLALMERFGSPDSIAAMRGMILADPQMRAAVRTTVRLGQVFGLPNSQEQLAALLLRTDGGASESNRGSLYMARALGRIALGQLTTALGYLDSASSLLGSREARFQTAQWRMLAPALGVPGFAPSEPGIGRAVIEPMTNVATHGPRAMWTLGVAAALAADTAVASQWHGAIRGDEHDSVATRLRFLLHAVIEGAAGNYLGALELSAPLIQADSAGRGGDPFARAVLHMKRADWLDSLGRGEAADSSRLWYEHFDWIGFPSGVAQAAEIDWALGTYARWLRGDAAARRGDHRNACRHLPRVAQLWQDADPAYEPLRRRAEAYIATSCSR